MATRTAEQYLGESELAESEAITGDAMVGETSMGLAENTLGALSYLFGFISGLLVYFLEENSEFARYHAAQSIVLSAVVIATWIGISLISTVGSIALDGVPMIGLLFGLGMALIGLAIWLGAIGVWLYTMISAFRGKRTRLPVVTKIAEQYLL
ncbi:DUF4870 domain-containing protein [Halalkalicoccus ordinarius]|uniref:DUF4870 domain-containing protein n=1 Tax=Halalkalicoccus ordinarius TaxID=3116651 RepID=UPI00300F4EE8